MRPRWALLVLGLAFVGSGGIPHAVVAAAVPPGGSAINDPTVVFPEGVVRRAPTVTERRAATDFRARALTALRHWADAGVAEAAGFVAPPGQAGVIHLVRDADLIARGAAPDPARPSSLVYLQTSRGLRLVGAMWMMADAGAPGADLGGPLTPWHAHADCRGPGGVSVPLPSGRCPASDTREVSAEMLHVWLPGVPDPFDTAMDPAVLACTIASGRH